MEKILRNCLKVLLVMVISISALNLGLVSALEENEEDVVVNYDDQVSGIAVGEATWSSSAMTLGSSAWRSKGFSSTSDYYNLSYVNVVTGSVIGSGYAQAYNGVGNFYSWDDFDLYIGTELAYEVAFVTGNILATASSNTSSSLSNFGHYITPSTTGITMGAAKSTASTTYETYTYITGYTIYVSPVIGISASHDVSLRNVTGGSLSSTVSKASAGSSVTVTAIPDTGYSLSSATVSGATNVSVNFFKNIKKSILLG